MTTAVPAEITPKVSFSMVSPARLCAGLRSGKNLSTPNQRKTAPRLRRSRVTPWRAIHPVRAMSVRSKEGSAMVFSSAFGADDPAG